jgi:diguanylate cyclase (GGDEF)-like protein/PAS domain S-box-containing protein
MVDTLQHQLNLVNGISKRELLEVSTVKGEGAFALDNDGTLLFINEAAERLLGWESNEILDKNFFDTVRFKVDAIATLGTSECAAVRSVGCSHLHKGANITRKDGSVLSIVFVSMPLFDKGRVCGKVFVFREYKDASIEEELYRGIIEGAGSAIVKLDLSGKVVFTNHYARDMFGNNIEAALPTKIVMALQQEPDSLSSQMRLKKQCRTHNGRSKMIAWTVRVLHGINDRVVGAVCVGNDITESARSNQKSRSRYSELLPDEALTNTVLDHIYDGVITVGKDGLVEYLNPVAEQMTGWVCHEAKGQPLKDVYHVVDEKTREPRINSVFDRQNRQQPRKTLLLRRDGWEFTIEDTSSKIRDENGNVAGAAIIFRDITELQGMERWMLYEATHDTLTGLINRREFDSRLNQALAAARAEGRHYALCYIDIYNFKLINEHHSREAGDELLKQIATLLHSKVRDTDVLARLSNDEFGVLLNNCSMHNAIETANAFRQAIRDHSFEWEGESINVGISIGLVPIHADSGGVGDVMGLADAACYVAKDKGNHRIHVYRSQDVAVKQRHADLNWVQRIRTALDENQFRLFCQNIVPLNVPDAQHMTHHEILLRMLDKNGDIIRPASFIPAAERYSLMPSIDRWVVQNALELLNDRLRRNQQIGVFAINLSAQSLDDENFLGFVIDQFDKTCIPASHICFEITESTAISNLMSATRFMSILRGMGCRFALDDFGRGFSSYGYLKNLQIDYLKIDGSFVRDLANDPVDHAMVESINQIGHIMGVQTIAEFVETHDALEKLMTLGVDHVQGYQLGKPRPMWHSFQSPPSSGNIR